MTKHNGAADRVVMITQPASNMRWPRLVRLIPDRRLNRYNLNLGSSFVVNRFAFAVALYSVGAAGSPIPRRPPTASFSQYGR